MAARGHRTGCPKPGTTAADHVIGAVLPDTLAALPPEIRRRAAEQQPTTSLSALASVVTHTAGAGVATPRLGVAPEDVALTTSDGLRLQAWLVPSRNGATVIVFTGRSGPQNQARMLIRHAYGVLLFDRRGEGASEGEPNAFGWIGTAISMRQRHSSAPARTSTPSGLA